MAVQVKNRFGKTITLRNPAEKGQKYAFELKNNYSASTGETLSQKQRSYRAGYLDARKDSAKAWKHNQKKKKSRSKKKVK